MTDDPAPTGDPTGDLERAYIAEFLRRRGHTFETLRDLPDADAHDLLKAASIYASGKLTEVESRSHYVDQVHGGTEALPAHAPPTPPASED
jgi:hypothetical protein